MSLRPDVSVVVPCYDAAATVADTLESVRRQSYSNWEAICVDDGSTDTTPEILEHFTNLDRRFRWQHMDHRGLAAARNRGTQLVKAERVFFLDSDDLLPRDALKWMVKASQRAGDNTIIAGGFELLDNEAQPLGEYRFPSVRNFTIDEILVSGGPSPMSLVPAALLRKYPFDERVPTIEDTDLWLRMAQAGVSCCVLPNIVIRRRLRRHSLAHHADARFQWGTTVLRKWLPLSTNPEQHRLLLHRLAWLCGAIAQSSGDYQALRRYLDTLPAVEFDDEMARTAANAIHWGFQFTRGAAGETWAAKQQSWLAEVGDWLSSQGFKPQAKSVCAHVQNLVNTNQQQLERVQALLANNPNTQRLLLYGVGHNGLVLLHRLCQAEWTRSIELAVADDGASNSSFEAIDLPRDNPRRWTEWPADTLVVVTPNEYAPMCDTLRQAGGQSGTNFITLADPMYTLNGVDAAGVASA